ncbi:MAG: hypothetical protein ACRD0I_03700 [Acidimicrobiales bacterium]
MASFRTLLRAKVAVIVTIGMVTVLATMGIVWLVNVGSGATQPMRAQLMGLNGLQDSAVDSMAVTMGGELTMAQRAAEVTNARQAALRAAEVTNARQAALRAAEVTNARQAALRAAEVTNARQAGPAPVITAQ